MEDIFAAGGIVVAAILMAMVIMGGARRVQMWVDNVPVTCSVNGERVYEGPSYAIDVNSGGATTTVIIYGGFLAVFPKAYYTSDDVLVVGKK